MKTSIKVLVIALIVATPGLGLKAQNVNTQNGIYLTKNDYKANKLTYTIGNGGMMRLNNFLDGKNVSLAYQHKKITLAKSEIFGYRLNNQDFRFYDNKAYAILDTVGFMLYSRQKLVQKVKGYAPVEHYFYSLDDAKPVLDLTMANLWNSFPRSAEFRYSLQNYFHSDDDLANFDRVINQYKIKYLYLEHKPVLAAHITK